METAILESGINVPKIHQIDEMFTATVQNLTEMLSKRVSNKINDINKCNSNKKKKKKNFISFDNVSCFSCKFWPQVATEWHRRNRKWPSSEHVEMIVNAGCFIVAKQSVANDARYKLEWRWSFSLAEMKIAGLRSPKMHYSYFVFKSLFYTYLKPKDNSRGSLASYIAKTCMFHLSEQKDESWWNAKQTSECVYHLMVFLRKCLKMKTLCHYFIKDLNLLSNLDNDVLKSSLEIVDMLLDNPVKYFVFDSGPVGTINDIKDEIQQVDSNTNVLSFSFGKELFRNRIEMCYEKRLSLVAENMRFKYLGKIDKLLENYRVIERFTIMQKMFLPSTSASAAEYVENFLENYNKPALTQLNEDLQKARENATKVLGGIRDLRKDWCTRCDGRCQQLIPCDTDRWKCRDSSCNFHICVKCYVSGRSSTAVEEHKHSLESTCQCSPYCYSHVAEREGPSLNATQNLIRIGSQLQSLATAFGTADDSIVFGNHGKIMSLELTKLYKSLGLKASYGKRCFIL